MWTMKKTQRKTSKKRESFAAGVGRGMRRAARTAREVARLHGTPICVWENGKVIAKKPWLIYGYLGDAVTRIA
jgi:hypothetical protein